MSSKPRVVKDYDKLDDAIIEKIKLEYPYGFDKYLVQFKNKEGKLVSALPFEAEDRYYLVRMTKAEALEIIEQDDDYSDDGVLKEDVKEEYEDKYLEEAAIVPDKEDAEDFGDDDDDDLGISLDDDDDEDF